ncbi:hypothetical protein HPB47_023101 [Ixodes persulcatus]|uniref:Uncharacterized protein n=1 Tax=Ixodes persulcatus TaxID=34615 RepID=A0AC60Q909_IXOPE|nr:hypothetical protein HPB47_023101 [Ixodes persulcatus]
MGKTKPFKPGASRESLLQLDREELVNWVQQLDAHVKQLQNVVAKNTTTTPAPVRKEKPFDFSRFKKRHVALRFLYLGWNYDGYVVQEDTANTVEAALFQALQRTRLLDQRETSNYHRCGRTDKGVSAFSQVISVDLRSNLTEGPGVFSPDGYRPNEKSVARSTELDYVKILNGVLPPDIRVLAWAPAEPSFSARFDCQGRTYRYFLPKGNLDVQRIQEAAKLLVGEHDFRNLCKMDVGNGVTRYVRRILSTKLYECTDSGEPGGGGSSGGYQMLCLEIVGQAFLWHQVRCIVAVLLLVGQGLEEPEVVPKLLDVEAHPCKPQYGMASEIPLVLYDCQFEGLDWRYDVAELTAVSKHLQKLWMHERVKSEMIRSMLKDIAGLPCMAGTEVLSQCDPLLSGPTARVYRPLLQRPVCDSLEERVRHFAKRRKIEASDGLDEDGRGAEVDRRQGPMDVALDAAVDVANKD